MRARLGFWILLAVVSLVSISTTVAQDYRIWDPVEGITIRQGLHIEWYRSMDSDADGNLCIVWSDTRTGDRDVYAMLIDPEGNQLWNEPLQVTDHVGRQEDPHVFPADDGNWIITWIDYRNDVNIEDKGDVYIQKINPDGEELWTENGVEVCVNTEKQISVQSFSDGDGGAVSIWVDGRSGSADIYAQRTNSDGVVQWTTDGLPVASGLGDQGNLGGGGFTSDTDGAGGIIAGWVDNRDATNQNLYVQRIDVNGDLVWSEEQGGRLLCGYDEEQTGLKMSPDGNGGAFFVWQDKRNDVAFGDVYGQRVDADGNDFWTENGEVICDATNAQSSLRIVNTEAGAAIVVWEDTRVDGISIDLYMQRISGESSMALSWGSGTEGIALCDATDDQTNLRVIADREGGASMTWLDERINEQPNFDLYGQRVDADGVKLWGDANGIVISDARGGQQDNIVRMLGNGRTVSVWGDKRNGSPGLYYQVIAPNGSVELIDNGVEIEYGIDSDARAPRIMQSGDYVYIGWADTRFIEATQAYLQKVDPADGSILWGRNGVNITPGFPFGEDTLFVRFDSVAFSPDGQGGILSAWSDNRQGVMTLVYAQRMDADGNPMWGDRGAEVAPHLYLDQIRPKIVPTGDGGMVILFLQMDDSFYQQVKAQRLDPDGNQLWGSEGTFITEGNNDHVLENFMLLDDNTIFLTYVKTLSDGATDLYAQIIDLDGDPVWDEPVVLCDESGFQFHSVTSQVNGGIVVAWEDTRRVQPITDLYGQFVNLDGSLDWTANGEMLIEQDHAQNRVRMGTSSDTANNFWLVWEDQRRGDQTDIYAQLFDLDGTPLLTDGGVEVSVAPADQENPRITVNSGNDIYVAWQDVEGESFQDLRYKHLLADGSNPDNIYPAEGFYLCSAFHRQENIAMIHYTDPGQDHQEGFIAAWEDLRSTGKDFLYNLFTQRVQDNTSDVNDNRGGVTPDSWALDGAYPNPFNPSTTLNFTVGEPAQVRLIVFDVLGRHVNELVNTRLSAGQHSVVWDGRDANGHLVASGTYFFKLEADGVQFARSMILLK